MLTAALPWLAVFVIGAAAHVSVVREIEERPVPQDARQATEAMVAWLETHLAADSAN